MTQRLRIVADRNMPQVVDRFSDIGEVVLLEGRDIQRQNLTDADVLLVRSVTKVDSALIADTPIRFIGSATAGIDHIDPAVRRSAIPFANAAGANARSVVEYDLAVLAYLHEQQRLDLFDLCVGVIGYGNVGRRLVQQLTALGSRCAVYDPFVDVPADCAVGSLAALTGCDVIAVHAPLTVDGDHPTVHMLSTQFFKQLKPGAVLLSAGRGGIVDEVALLPLLQASRLIYCADVWQGEPRVEARIKSLAQIATPHIAGYSVDSKITATWMLRQAVAAALSLPMADSGVVAGDLQRLDMTGLTARTALITAIRQAFPIERDDAGFRAQNSASGFDQLRANYWQRREFSQFCVRVDNAATGDLLRLAAFTTIVN